MYSKNTHAALTCSTHMSTGTIGSCAGLVMAIGTLGLESQREREILVFLRNKVIQ